MGDWFDSYVARRLEVPDAASRASSVVSWMLENELIEPGLGDAPLSGSGYRPGPRATEAVEGGASDSLHSMRTNGVMVTTERSVFYAFDTEETTCPICGSVVERDAWDEVCGDWHAGEGNGLVSCRGCGSDVALCDLVMDDPWGFSNLAVTFWNWGRLSRPWERQLEAVVGLPLVHVSGKL